MNLLCKLRSAGQMLKALSPLFEILAAFIPNDFLPNLAMVVEQKVQNSVLDIVLQRLGEASPAKGEVLALALLVSWQSSIWGPSE